MPYPKNEDLPAGIKVLPAAAQTMWRKTFNSAVSTYDGDEDRARRVAWASVKRKYIKNEAGNWVLRETVQSFLELVCKRIDAFSQPEIIGMIPEKTLAQIKEKDDHPYFAAYSICHEGVSQPKVIGEGFKPILWTRKAVQSLKGLILKGIRFFIGHNDDNSTDKRNAVGTVVADTQREINGKLNHIVVGYFPDKEAVADKDVCSQEGNWNLFENAKRWIADTADKITAIALGTSKIDTPAFEDAKRLGMVQAFETSDKDDKNQGRKETKRMNIQEVRDAVRELNLIPSQLFAKEDIEKDRDFGIIFEDHKKELEEKDTKIETLTKNEEGLNRQIQLSTAKGRIEELANGMFLRKEITELQKEYIINNAKSLDDPTDEGLKKHVDKNLEDYKTNSAFFGKEDDAEIDADEGGKDSTDITKSENNPYLDEDFDGDSLD